MKGKVKVDVKQATEFLALGYEVEHYVVMAPKAVEKVKFKKTFIPQTAVIGISVQHSGPTKGAMGVIWPQVKAKLWGKSATITHKRPVVEDALKHAGSKDSGMFSYLIRSKCIRVVE